MSDVHQVGTGLVVPVLGGRGVPMLDSARMYVCGITPYDVTHLGHAATFVWVDALVRVLRLLKVEPEVCRNVTDVDDVLDAAAFRASTPYDSFAAIQQYHFEHDLGLLNVRPVRHEPRAHRYIEHVIRLASGLMATGTAYQRGGSVYFRGPGGGRGAGPGRGAAAVRRVRGRPDDPAKDDPLDTAVWQGAEAGHPAWDSPWGAGRPGWHAECVAMALSAFGVGVDVHAGGNDLRFPHHAYHAAMAEAFTGVRPYARAWMHVGVVTVGGVKMAKSAGNLVLVGDLLDAPHGGGDPADDPGPALGAGLGLQRRVARGGRGAAGGPVPSGRPHERNEPGRCRRDPPAAGGRPGRAGRAGGGDRDGRVGRSIAHRDPRPGLRRVGEGYRMPGLRYVGQEGIGAETPALGDRSYLVHDGATAVVVDPQRDIGRVLAVAQAPGCGSRTCWRPTSTTTT